MSASAVRQIPPEKAATSPFDRDWKQAGEVHARVTFDAGENSSTMFVSKFANCFGYQWVNRLRRIFGGAIATIEIYGA
jgi:hypothetical protein